jgi:4-amino-4-deoxy-L-arabinose transferase-like glycosyltransferase
MAVRLIKSRTLPRLLSKRSGERFSLLTLERTGPAFLILLSLCSFLFFYGLNTGELWRTENLRALVASDFLRTGNWLVPRLYGEPLLTKPPGMYAAIALASWPMGTVREWSARLPSAIAATASVFVVYWLFRRYLGAVGGLVAAVITPTSFMWLDKSSVAEIDMLQVAWVTAAIAFFLRALEVNETAFPRRSIAIDGYRLDEPHPATPAQQPTRLKARGSNLAQSSARPHVAASLNPEPAAMPNSHAGAKEFFWWLAALLCVAGGLLTKWTAPAFFYTTVVSLLWWRGRLRLLFGWKHITSAAVAAGLCLIWITFAVAEVGWDTFYGTLSREAIARFFPTRYGDPYPWLEVPGYPFYIWAINLPWSVTALFALSPGFGRLWDSRSRLLLQALHCWLWPNLAFWSLISEHAPRHSFPIFPAVAGLAAFVSIAWINGYMPWPVPRVRPAHVLVGVVLMWLALKLAFVHFVIPARNAERQPRAKGEQLATAVPRGETLYVFHLKDKDEGIMFYYRRAVKRVAGPESLPTQDQALYCLLEEWEWQEWQSRPNPRHTKVAFRMPDEYGQPLLLIKVDAKSD